MNQNEYKLYLAGVLDEEGQPVQQGGPQNVQAQQQAPAMGQQATTASQVQTPQPPQQQIQQLNQQQIAQLGQWMKQNNVTPQVVMAALQKA